MISCFWELVSFWHHPINILLNIYAYPPNTAKGIKGIILMPLKVNPKIDFQNMQDLKNLIHLQLILEMSFCSSK